MSDLLFVDTSVFVEYLVDGEKANVAEDILLGNWAFLTSPTVYREAIGALALIVGRREFGIKGKYSLRRFVAKRGWEPFSEVVTALNGLFDEIVMPSDAQIVLTCWKHNVKNIATFDSDFRRVNWLKTLGV